MNNRNGNENLNERREPGSLLRDRPLAEPRRHRHSPVVTMNGETRIHQQRHSASGTPMTQYTQQESSTSQSTPAIPSPQSPTSERSSSFLPSIDEGRSGINYRRKSDSNAYEKKPINRTENGSSSMSQVPSLAAVSDSSDDSLIGCGSMHSTDSSNSESSEDFDYENDDDNEISASIRSTQSMPPILSGNNINSTRRRPDSMTRSFRSTHLNYGRSMSTSQSTIKPSPSYSSIETHRKSIPPPPFAMHSRRRSYPPSSQSYATTKTGTFPSIEYCSKSRRQCLGNFLLSGVCMQLLLLLGIALLVVWSRTEAAFATDTLLRLKESESMGLLKLHRLESHSMHIHEQMRHRILRESNRNKDFDYLLDGEDLDEAIGPEDDPLMNQYEHLVTMSADLHKHADITTLQRTIQETAVDEIISTFGEGPVKVVVELDFGDKTTTEKRDTRRINNMVKGTYISIILWPDTPHAAWTWLEQIRRSIWDGSFLKLNPTSTLLQVGPTKHDPKDRGHLEFVESHSLEEKSNPDMHHGAWTIGLRETISEDHKKSHLEMFINLADNREELKHETCIGKIFDGFDALQRLLEGIEVSPDGEANTSVSVKSVSAMHMTHHELQQIYR